MVGMDLVELALERLFPVVERALLVGQSVDVIEQTLAARAKLMDLSVDLP